MPLYRAQRVQRLDGTMSATLIGPEGVVAAAERYLAFLDDLGRSHHTVRAYASDLALYFEFLHLRGSKWDEVDMGDLASFSAHLRLTNRARRPTNVVVLRTMEADRAPASVQRALSAIMGFYDFYPDTPAARSLKASRLARENVRHAVSRTKRSPLGSKVPHRIARFLSEDELWTVLRTPSRYRDRLLLALMGLNGLRIGAALGLRHEDISLRRRELRVVPRRDNANDARAKRASTLLLPLHSEVAALYAEYLEVEYGEWDSDYVFVNLWSGDLGRPMTYDTARGVVARVARAARIPFTPHTLRHTFATLLRRRGVSMEAVSELLGHSHVNTTRETYVHTTVEDLRRSLSRIEEESDV